MSREAGYRDHDRWEGDAAAYVLDALDDVELRSFEAHLDGCVRCKQELAAMRSTLEALPGYRPAEPPPAILKQRVMATVRSEAAQPPAPMPQLRRQSWGLAAAAAAVVVALAVVVIALTSGGGSSVRTYAGIVNAPGASASLRRSEDTATLRVSRLPAPPAGRIYQLWLERAASQTPQPTQALFAFRNGTVTVRADMRGVQAVLVTAEPRPFGSQTPTRTPIIVVRLA